MVVATIEVGPHVLRQTGSGAELPDAKMGRGGKGFQDGHRAGECCALRTGPPAILKGFVVCFLLFSEGTWFQRLQLELEGARDRAAPAGNPGCADVPVLKWIWGVNSTFLREK